LILSFFGLLFDYLSRCFCLNDTAFTKEEKVSTHERIRSNLRNNWQLKKHPDQFGLDASFALLNYL